MTRAVEERERATVVIADDHPLYRAALGEAVESSARLELVALASDGNEALAAVRLHEPDVVLLDMRMPELDGQTVARRLAEQQSSSRVLFISEYHDGELVLGALSAGGSGYLTKAATAEQICAAIEQVAAGECVLPPDVGQGLATAVREHRHVGVHLSAREQTVLELLAEGNTAPLIAGHLHLATPTVKTHIKNLYTKLGVSDRGSAVAEAMRRGLVQ
ncbi:MAG TPA: response regulator transcription factor [Solirubrobacteraceae bacterium]|nr:response regulator transcription factor [Solirubrobacteraceae bacterium]